MPLSNLKLFGPNAVWRLTFSVLFLASELPRISSDFLVGINKPLIRPYGNGTQA
jgi:hypothetical protein